MVWSMYIGVGKYWGHLRILTNITLHFIIAMVNSYSSIKFSNWLSLMYRNIIVKSLNHQLRRGRTMYVVISLPELGFVIFKG